MIKLYTKPNCSFCESAKNFLKEKNISFTSFEIGKDISREQILELFPNSKSVPIILNSDGSLIGGYTELVESYNNNLIGKTLIID